MTNALHKRLVYFVGVDVSRNELDFSVMFGAKYLFHKEVVNDKLHINAFLLELKLQPTFKPTRSVFCLEHIGMYSNHLLACLRRFKTNIVIQDSLQIKYSLGTLRGKDDKTDSYRICQYAYRCRETLSFWAPKRVIIQQLTNLSTLRSRLLQTQLSLTTPLNDQKTFMTKVAHSSLKNCCKSTLTALKEDLNNLNKLILNLIRSDTFLSKQYDIITSVPFIGLVAATQFLISTNEFRDIKDPKKFACYAGVAPFRRESGKMIKRPKLSHIANKKVKALLHICAMSSIKYDSEFKEYFVRKTKIDSKPKMVVINAIRNKLILRVFACVNQQRLYDKEYARKRLQSLEVTDIN